MRVMFVIRSMARGGAQRQLVVLARGLAERGHDVFVSVFYGGEAFEEDLLSGGVKVIDLRKKNRWHSWSFYKDFSRMVHQVQPDILHPYLPTPNVMCSVLRWTGSNVPVVLGVRASNMAARWDWATYVSLVLERACARLAEAVIVNSEAGKRELGAGLNENTASVIPNGIDTGYFRPDRMARTGMRAKLGIGANTTLVGIVARVDPMKDYTTFLRAAAIIRASTPGAHFVCVGSSADRKFPALQRLAIDLGLGNCLTWLGEQRDMLATYNALDVLCLSSAYGEGFPNVLAEGMACGLPCVATDVGDSGKVIFETGRVVPPRDPDAFAQAVLRALKEDTPISRNARVEAVKERYSVDRLVDRTETTLTSLLAKHRARSE